MKTEKSRPPRRAFARLLVLVPHRDARRPLRGWSGSLHAAGLAGAWSFPWVAPLAALGRSPSRGELGLLARALRGSLGPGKITAGPAALAPLPLGAEGGPALAFGPALGAGLTGGLFEPAGLPPMRRVSPAVLGAAILRGPPPEGLPPPPEVSFRAAALAEMILRPIRRPGESGGLSFEWEIGEPRWLPG